MDKQKLFDTAINGILKQGRPAIDPDRRACEYLGQDGCKCAVGQLMTEGELAKAGKFSGGVGGLFTEYPDIRKRLGADTMEDENFLAELQLVHDEGYLRYETNPDYWRMEFARRVEEFAKAYKLTLDNLIGLKTIERQ